MPNNHFENNYFGNLVHHFGLIIDPKVIITDFELAAIKAFQLIYPKAQMNGCLFHFGQTLFKNLSKLFLYIGPIWKLVPESLDTIIPSDLRIGRILESNRESLDTRHFLAAGFIGRVGPLVVNSNFLKLKLTISQQ